MKVILPWPPSKLSANGSQGDYFGKAEAGRAYKNACMALCREKGRGLRRLPPNSKVKQVTVTFCAPSKVHRYDLDNMLKRMKQGLDAVAEAIGVDDADWQAMFLRRGERSKNGGVIVEIGTHTGELIP